MNWFYIVKTSLVAFALWAFACIGWRVFFSPSGLYDLGTFFLVQFITGIFIGWKSNQWYKTQTILAMVFFLIIFILLAIAVKILIGE